VGELGENERLELLRFERFAVEEALGVVDVLGAEVVELANGFDVFGERPDAKVTAELDENADECVGFGGAVDRVGDSRSILIVSTENC
jgi:hypothetical protein